MIRVALLWHMHQPVYQDPLAEVYRLPWVRLHALKDYYGMVRLLREFPDVRVSFNIVPVLADQILDYAEGRASDPFLDVVRVPAERLDDHQKRFILRYFFQANPERMIARFGRYKDLYQKFRGAQHDPDRAFRSFNVADYRDLQVLSQLVWMDESFFTEEPLQRLTARGCGYTAEDQQHVCAIQQELIARVLPEYRAAAERGQVELSTSPYFHPILPLLCDTELAHQAHTDIALPRQRFRYPQDAREQLRRARARHEELFGIAPAGLWPSEGSVSDEVGILAADLGFRWMASDEGVLARSLGDEFVRDGDGRVLDAQRLYTPYRFRGGERGISVFFRDRQLSDLIGFVYSQLEPQQAADDFLQRVRLAASTLSEAGKDPVVTVILDGENPWENYPEGGRAFLRALYRGLSEAEDVATCTFSDIVGPVEAEAPARPHLVSGAAPLPSLPHISPGSWINANFDIWIGADEDNRAWEWLADARRELETRTQKGLDPARRERALRSLFIAEGSDWNWWYGPEHRSENATEFDQLFRTHLAAAYQAMAAAPPTYLQQPIIHAAPPPVIFEPPTGWIHPFIDGEVSSYFEWLGAASYCPDRRTAAMHGKRFSIASVHIGYDDKFLYLRMDFLPLIELTGELRFELEGTHSFTLLARVQAGRLEQLSCENASMPSATRFALGRIAELRFPRADLGADASYTRARIRISHWSDGLPREVLPQDGEIEIRFEPKDVLAAVI